MAVDLHIGESRELREHRRILVQHAGHVHELGQPQHLRMMLEGQQVFRLQPGARRFEVGRRHAGGKLNAQIHYRDGSAFQKVLQTGKAQHVADFVRIADRRRRPARRHAAVELQRRHQRRLAMDMAVDEPRHGNQPTPVDLGGALVGLVGAHDAIARDRNIAHGDLARGQVENADRFDDQIRRHASPRLIDDVSELRRGDRIPS